jgi:hypothetical protein
VKQTKENEIRFDRVPPQDIDAERALIGSLIEPVGTKETIEKAIRIGVLPEIFYKTAHQYLCTAILNLYEKESPVDLITLSQELMNTGLIEQVGDVSYLDELLDSTPTSKNMAYYAVIVKENKLKRSAIEKATKLYNDCFEHDIEIDFLIKQHNESMENLKELYNSGNGKSYGLSLEEIMAMDIPPSKWIVKNYIPEGLTLIAGPSKAGKSWLMYQLAIATATPNNNGMWLGSLPILNNGHVLYLALEDSIRRIQDRVNLLCQTSLRPSKIRCVIETPKLDTGGLSKIRHWIETTPESRLVIIDVWEKFVSHKSSSKNAYQEDYENLEPLKKLAKDYRISIVIVDHKNKSNSADILDTIQNSVGKQGVPDGLIILKRLRKEKTGSLYRTGKDYDEDDEMAIKFDLTGGVGWSLIGNADEHQLTEQRKAIIELLESTNEPMSPKQIAENLEIKPDYIRKTLRRLIDTGMIKQFGRGQYIVQYNK